MAFNEELLHAKHLASRLVGLNRVSRLVGLNLVSRLVGLRGFDHFSGRISRART